MQVGRVFVDPAMPLMFLEAQSLGEFGLNFLQRSSSQPGFVFRPKTYDEMIGLFLQSPGVESLGIGDLLDGQSIIVVRPAPGAPSQKTFFAVTAGVGDVVGQTAVIVVFRFSGDSSTDHHCVLVTMLPDVGHVAKPTPDLGIGRGGIKHQSRSGKPAGQGDVKTAAQIADEAFHLALGLCPIRCAQPWHEAEVLGRVPKTGMEAVLALAMGVSLDDDGTHDPCY